MPSILPRFNMPKCFKRLTTEECSNLLDKMQPNIKSASFSESRPRPEDTANYYIQKLKRDLNFVKNNGKEQRSEKRKLKQLTQKLFKAVKGTNFENDSSFIDFAKRLEGKVRRDPEFYNR